MAISEAVKPKNPYTITEKTRAFFKGLRTGSPLLEVALGGLAKNGIPETLRAKYLLKVVSTGVHNAETAYAVAKFISSTEILDPTSQHCLVLHISTWDSDVRLKLTSLHPSPKFSQAALTNALDTHNSSVANIVLLLLTSSNITHDDTQVILSQMLKGTSEETARSVSLSFNGYRGRICRAAMDILDSLMSPGSSGVSSVPG